MRSSRRSASQSSPGCTPPSSPARCGGAAVHTQRLTRRSRSRAMQPTGAQSRRSLAHGQHPSGHVQDVGSHQSGQVSGQEFNPGPGYGDGAWSSPSSSLQPSCSPCYLAPPFARFLHFVGVPMWSSQARGVEGHQWRLHRTSGTHLPCRIVCQCGWASAAGTNTATLLELKGHLEDSLHNGARLIQRHEPSAAKLPDRRAT